MAHLKTRKSRVSRGNDLRGKDYQSRAKSKKGPRSRDKTKITRTDFH